MKFVYDDGGREEAGFKGTTGDCVCRAIAIATEKPYKEVYDLINKTSKVHERKGKRKRGTSNARTGVYKQTIKRILEDLGWTWHPTMTIGSGCQVHLKAEELPSGRIICNVSKHIVAVIDGVIHDTYDCSRDETRCVYGYYSKDNNKETKPITTSKQITKSKPKNTLTVIHVDAETYIFLYNEQRRLEGKEPISSWQKEEFKNSAKRYPDKKMPIYDGATFKKSVKEIMKYLDTSNIPYTTSETEYTYM